jgi:hypothetical protein
MKTIPPFIRYTLPLILLFAMVSPPNVWAGMPVPSTWQGEITGQTHNTTFRLPLVIEFKRPLSQENNPLNIFIGAGDPGDIGHIYLSSALGMSTNSGPATLQYLSVSVRGSHLEARLTNHHGAAAAKANGFSGPNVSAEQASDLMRDVLRDAWGPTEMFAFGIGATLVMDVNGNRLTGEIQGSGSSYTGTSSNVEYRANLSAQRAK